MGLELRSITEIIQCILQKDNEVSSITIEYNGNTPNHDVDEELVKVMKQHPNLYDENNEFHYNRKKKRNSWISISRLLELDVATAQCRWQELLDTFAQEYINFPPLGKPSRKKKDHKFRLFDKMLWLVPYIPKCLEASTVATKVKIEETKPKKNIVIEEKQVKNIEKPPSPAVSPVCREENKSDHFFMMSVMQDLQHLSTETKFKFKRDVLELLETCMSRNKK